MKRIIPVAIGATLVVASLAACSATAATTMPEETKTAKPALVAPPAIATAEKLTVCTALSTGNPPTYFTDQDNTPVGAEIEMAQWIGDHLGLETDFLDVAFASIIPSLQAGKCDVIMSSLYIKPEREEIVGFVPYLRSGSAVAVQKGNPEKITGMDDSLCGLTISAAVGKTATLLSEQQAEACAAAGKPALEVVQTDQTTAAVQQLINKQVDAYAGETPVVLYYQDSQPNTFEMTGEPFGLIDVGAAVNKGNAELQTAINDAFVEMDAEGVYDDILKKWGMTDLAYTFN